MYFSGNHCGKCRVISMAAKLRVVVREIMGNQKREINQREL